MNEVPTATVYVQYKGTDICLDFTCSCGAGGHFDGYHAYSVTCGSCGQVWLLPQSLALTRLEDGSDHDRQWHSDGVTLVMN